MAARPRGAANSNRHTLGSHQRLGERATNLKPIINMGARPYNPTLGRFLRVDPVEGGTENDYTYPTDPVNMNDLDGRMALPGGEWLCAGGGSRCGKSFQNQYFNSKQNQWNDLNRWTRRPGARGTAPLTKTNGFCNWCGRAAQVTGWAAVVVGLAALTVATAGTAAPVAAALLTTSVALGYTSTAFSAGQMMNGAQSGNRCDFNAGLIGTSFGILSPWNAVPGAAANAWGAASRSATTAIPSC